MRFIGLLGRNCACGGAFWGLPGLSLGSSWLLIISFCAFTFLPTPLGLSCGSPSPRLWSLRRCSVRLWLCRSLALGRPPLCHRHFCCRLFARLRGLGFFVFLRGQVFGQFGQFRHLLDKFSNNWWTNFGPVLDQIGPSRGQDGPKRAIKSFKDPKRCISTNSEDL